MVIAAAAPAGGPNWTDILTAIGTVGAVIVAVGIALWTEHRSDGRIKEERARSDRILADQRERERAAIADERSHSREQIREERQIARDREQFAEAYAVQVVLAERVQTQARFVGDNEPLRPQTTKLVIFVKNRGSFTITQVKAQFCLNKTVVEAREQRRMTSFADLPESFQKGHKPAVEHSLGDVLTPFDVGMRFDSNEMPYSHGSNPYPIARWVDRWGTRWENKRGTVQQVEDFQPWEP